jgi:hypothetical protein
MGVRTKHFGPHAWKFFNSLAAYLDRRHIDYHPFFENVGLILPCIYCRSSYPRFYQLEKHHASAKRFIYAVHNRVNHKLELPPSAAPSYDAFSASLSGDALDLVHMEIFFYYCCFDSSDFNETLRYFKMIFGLVPELKARLDRLNGFDFSTMDKRTSVVRFIFGCGKTKDDVYQLAKNGIVGFTDGTE